MELIVSLYESKDNYEKPIFVTLLHGNIILDEETQLPGCEGNFIQFVAGYSPIYSKVSKGKVNTRIRYPAFRGEIGNNYLYCKLNWFQRQKLSLITRQSWFHKNPIATLAFLINTIFLFANLIFAIVNFKNTSQKIESKYLQTIEKQLDYSIKQMNIFDRQIEIMNEQIKRHQLDSTSMKK